MAWVVTLLGGLGRVAPTRRRGAMERNWQVYLAAVLLNDTHGDREQDHVTEKRGFFNAMSNDIRGRITILSRNLASSAS
jgi:hypothetical protein